MFSVFLTLSFFINIIIAKEKITKIHIAFRKILRNKKHYPKVLQKQHAKKGMSDSPGLVDFVIGLVNPVPKGK